MASRKKWNNSDEIQKDLKLLGKICHKCTEEEGAIIKEEDREQANLEISKLNGKYELEIDEVLEDQWSEERKKDLKNWWKILNTKVQYERKKEEATEINKYIDI